MGIIVKDILEEVSSDDGIDSDELHEFFEKLNSIDSQQKLNKFIRHFDSDKLKELDVEIKSIAVDSGFTASVFNSRDYNKRFMLGMYIDYNVLPSELFKQWKYAGGNTRSHASYLRRAINLPRLRKGLAAYERPPYKSQCVCRTPIVEQCYLTNDVKFAVVGNCCIKHWMGESGYRTCEICRAKHRNIIINWCKECRIGRCDRCGDKCSEKGKLCYNCKKGL